MNPKTNSTKAEAPKTEAPSAEVAAPEPSKEVSKLADGANLAAVVAKVNELVDRANSKRDRGPNSTRDMTEEDAKRIMLGDLKDTPHTQAANILGLSYGQVYSARKGFTYKGVYKASAKIWG